MSVRLIEGDCLEMMAGMESGSVDLVLADPPYGSTECTWDSVIPLGPLWAELRRVIRPRGAITLCCKQPFTSALIASNREMFRYCWYWEKSKGANFAQTGYRPLAVVEEVAVFSPAPAVYSRVPTMRYFPQKEKLERSVRRKWAGTLRGSKETNSPSGFVRNPERLLEKTYTERTPRSLIYAADDHEDGLHPTQKPTSLTAYLVRTYTEPGDLVLDFCAGSGTTGVACLREGRSAILIEREPAYCAIIHNRLAAERAALPLFAGMTDGADGKSGTGDSLPAKSAQ
jgi:site-specific DNA-methyltransferase (adenine-specific)